MQQYAINGDWERADRSRRWLEWSTTEADEITGWFQVKGRRIRMYSEDSAGRPDQCFASGRVGQLKLLRSLDTGEWGSNPDSLDGSTGVVDVWGSGINKLASLVITDQQIYDMLFGA